MKYLMPLLNVLFVAGCVSVPPEVAKTHQKEQEIVQGLQTNHLALVDVYVDQNLAEFETFYFQEYGPAYRANWMELFRQSIGRDYDPAQDFPLF